MQSWFSSGVCRAWAVTGLAWTEAGKQNSGPGSLTMAVLTHNATTQMKTGLISLIYWTKIQGHRHGSLRPVHEATVMGTELGSFTLEEGPQPGPSNQMKYFRRAAKVGALTYEFSQQSNQGRAGHPQ